jgi:hypothetical protein
MIQPNELRIGNYLNSRKGYTKVVGVLCDMIETETHSDILDNFDPIPITPEILERLGFERSKKENSANVWVKYIGLREFNIASDFAIPNVWMPLYEVYRQGMVHSLAEFSNLHQLQNLIYSLTNKELTFKTN